MLKAEALHIPVMSVSYCDEPVAQVDASPVTRVHLRVKTALKCSNEYEKYTFLWAAENPLPEGMKYDEIACSTLI